ncbi:unnamed protein product, partial [Laminaria digitata]
TWRTQDVTTEAKRIAADHTAGAGGVGTHPVFGGPKAGSDGRVPLASSYTCRGKLAARGKEKIQYGDVSERGS